MPLNPMKSLGGLSIEERDKIAARFWSEVEFTESSFLCGCWLWTKALSKGGYGLFGINYKLFYAHRVAFELMRGQIPANMTLDHLCRNAACVNPDHLEAVSMKENLMRGFSPSAINARKTHCPKGHDLTGHLGQRFCVICHKESVNAWRGRNLPKVATQMRQYRRLNKDRINAQRREKYRAIAYAKRGRV